ncbi:MAG TPA: hypothetical protein PKJ68_04475 [Candidatus Woesebacteria bacterium]|nr:hypothetical protein [Candidatus Woesebacteria bacterium]
MPAYWSGFIKGLLTGAFAVLLAIAVNWSITHWKAIVVTIQNPEVVADLQIDTRLTLKK